MRYVDVTDDFVEQVLKANHLQEAEKIEEGKKISEPEEVNEEVNEAEHVCPLCESELDGPSLTTHLQRILQWQKWANQLSRCCAQHQYCVQRLITGTYAHAGIGK